MPCDNFKKSPEGTNFCAECGWDIENHVPSGYGIQEPVCFVDKNGERDEVK